MPRLPCASSTILQGQHDLDESDIGNLHSPYILVFKDPFTNLPIGICAIYFHLKVPSTKHFFGTGERGWQYHLYIYALSRRDILKEHPAGDFKFYEQEGPFIFTNLTIIWFSNMFEFANHVQDILCPNCSGLYSFVMPKCGHFWRTY